MVYDTVDVTGVAVADVANVSDSVMNVGGPGGPMLANHAATCYGDGFQSKSNVISLLPFLFFCMFVHVMFHVLVFVVKITWKHVVCDVRSFLVECRAAPQLMMWRRLLRKSGLLHPVALFYVAPPPPLSHMWRPSRCLIHF